MRTWRSARNKVAGTILLSALKKAASTGAVLCTALMATVTTAGAQAPAPPAVSTPAPTALSTPAPTAAVAQAPAKPLEKPKPLDKPLDKPLWASLTPSQKIALAPIADEWDQADGVRKLKWLDIANRFASMKPDEQARVHARMRDLFKMTPEERRVVRENFTRAKKIGPTQKSEEWEKYQQLPEEKKKQLADEAASERAKKQVANLPSASQSSVKTVAPIKRTPPVGTCAPGTVHNTASATMNAAPCVPAPAAATTAAPPAAVAPAATTAPLAPLAPSTPATPAAPVNPTPAAPVPAHAPAPAPVPNAK